MNNKHSRIFGGLAILLLTACWLAAAEASGPGWWYDSTNGTSIITANATPNDNAPVTLGQLKNVVAQAQKYLDIRLVDSGGSGPLIGTLVSNFNENPDKSLQVVNIGQLKFVATPFYDRLQQAALASQITFNVTSNLTGWPTSGNANITTITSSWGNWTEVYPWPPNPPGPIQSGYNGTIYNTWLQNQYDVAKLGQLKFVFSFDLGSITSTEVSNYTASLVGAPIVGTHVGPVSVGPDGGDVLGDGDASTFPIYSANGTYYAYTIPVQNYDTISIGQGRLVDMNNLGEVLFMKTYDDEDLFSLANTQTNSWLWDGQNVYEIPGTAYGDFTPPLQLFQGHRVDDYGDVLGISVNVSPDMDLYPFTPGYWAPGMSSVAYLDGNTMTTAIDAAAGNASFEFDNETQSFVYADNEGNIYFMDYGGVESDNSESSIAVVMQWNIQAGNSSGAVQGVGDSIFGTNITLAETNGHQLVAHLNFSDEGILNYYDTLYIGNVDLYLDDETAPFETGLPANPESLTYYAHEFADWADTAVWGGDDSASLMLVFGAGSTSATLYDYPDGSAVGLTSLSSYGIATTSTGDLWYNEQSWSIGDTLFADMVASESNYVAAHYGTSGNMDNDNEVYVLVPSSGGPAVFSASEASGASHRKIALNGRPLPDGKPQTAPESDQQPEETFVDALTQGLRHNVTDLHAPVAGTDLPLNVMRVYNEEIWDIHGGLQPDQHKEWAFGPAWRTNLTPNVRFEYTSGNLMDAYVTDEDGDEYHFLGGFIPDTSDGSAYFHFLPYPASRHEKNTFLATLTTSANVTNITALEDGNVTVAFKKKYGTQIVFQLAPYNTGNNTLYQETNNGLDAPNETYIFYRAQYAEDRLGYELQYNYPSNTTMVPNYIYMQDATGSNITGAYMNITTYNNTSLAWNGLVQNVTDADHTMVSYEYGSFNDSNGTITPELTKVMVAGAASISYNGTSENITYSGSGNYGNVSYTYGDYDLLDDFVAEPDYTPHSFLYEGHIGLYDHLALSTITDQNGNTYGFQYGLPYNGDWTRGVFDNNGEEYYPSPGRPQILEQIYLPGNLTTTFDSDVLLEINNNGDLVEGDDGFSRNLTVTDADGRQVIYTWTDAKLLPLDVPAALGGANSGQGVVQYGTMTISYPGTGADDSTLQETYTFNPNAGMAVESATDVGGAFTRYIYGDSWAAPFWYTQVLPSILDITGNFDDPTEEIDANGGVKKFTYNSLHLMSDIVDPNGNLTHYTFDSGNLGLRTAEQHYEGNTTSGNLVAETDYAYGNTSFTGALTQKIVNGLGTAPNLTTNFTLTGAGRVGEEVVGGNLALTTFHTYSNRGDLLSTTQVVNGSLNLTTSMIYDGRHRLTEVEYPDSSTKNYTYDARGNELSEEDENGHFTEKEYDSLNRLTSVTRVMSDANGTYNTGGNLTTSYTYSNTSARLTVADSYGDTTTYGYDGLNRLMNITTPEVDVNGTGQQLVTTYSYDGGYAGGSVFDSSSFKPTSMTDPRGIPTNYSYDSLGHMLTQSIEYASGNYANLTHTYDANGNVLSSNDTWQNTTFAYDALNRLIQTSFADGSNITANYTTTGLLYLKTDELERETETVFDTAGRPIEVEQPDPSTGTITGNSPITNMTYDGVNNVKSVTDPDGNEITYAYDLRNRRTTTTFPTAADWGNTTSPGNITVSTITTSYDAVGNALNVTDQLGNTTMTLYDDANRPTFTYTPQVGVWNGTGSSPAALVTARGYDKNGNVLLVLQGSDNGTLALTRNTTTNEYDALNRLTQTTDAANITVAYEYDAAGNRVLVTDGLSQNTTYTYDGLNRVLTIGYPVGNDTVYTYDPTHVDTVNYGNATGFGYSYDDRDRMTGRGEYTYTYDAASQVLSVTNDYDSYEPGGDLIFNDAVYYSYDKDGRVLTENQGGNGTAGGVTNTYTYDNAGNRLQVVYGSGVSGNRTLNSVYDTLNRVSNITDVTSGNLVTTYHYDLAGHRVGLLDASGSNITTTFDALGRQTEITGSRTSGNVTTTPYSFNLTYDEYSNLGQQVETYQTVALGLSNRTVTLAYDRADRLTGEVLAVTNASSVTTNITSNYTYDAAFNRKSKVTTSVIGGNVDTLATTANISYNYTGDQLQWDHDTVANATANFTYDGAGNRIKELLNTATVPGNATAANITAAQFASLYANEIDYGYDDLNRLANVTLNGNYTTPGVEHALTEILYYHYDYQNRRAIRGDLQTAWPTTEAQQVWQEVYDGQGPVRDDYASAAGSWTLGIQADYVRGSDWGGGIGGVLYAQTLSGNANTAKYYNYDGRGDVVALTSNTGNVTYAAAYNAYGQHATVTASNVTTTGTQEVGTDTDLFRLTTKEEDPFGGVYDTNRELGLNDNNWFQRDPAGMVNGPNPYTYVEQNPWTKFDPLGLMWYDNWNDLVDVAKAARGGLYDNTVGTAVQGYKSGETHMESGFGEIANAHSALDVTIGTLDIVAAGGDAAGVVLNVTPEGKAEKLAVEGTEKVLAKEGEQVLGTVEQKTESTVSSSAKADADKAADKTADAAPKGMCFIGGTPILTANGFVAIESLRVGQRVLTSDDTTQQNNTTSINPATWKLVKLRMPNPDGSNDVLEMQCLRSPEWLAANSAKVGAQIYFVLKEMGLAGTAQVVAIENCPPIESGKGRVILSTVTHLNGYVLHIEFEGKLETLEPTDTHRLFSLDRNDWIPAGELKVGEKLKTTTGFATISSIQSKPGIFRVYNMEVETEHCYFAGDLQILSHNANPCAATPPGGGADPVPERITSPKHNPNSTSPEPANVDELYKNSVVDKNGVRWAKDADGTVHRFSKPSNGQSHWNGSTAGSDPIQEQNIPNNVKKQLN